MIKIILVLVVFCILHVNAFTNETDCKFQDTCERCLSTSLQCAWCTDKSYVQPSRCLKHRDLLIAGCSAEHIYENEPQLMLLENEPLKDYERIDERAVQVQPQKVYVKLVKSNPQRIKFTYRPARENPLDLYFLMDLTWTMRDDKDTLVKLGAALAEELRNLTSNYRLGFGSYADKPAMPMIAHTHRVNPCVTEQQVCEPTYSFRHQLELTEEIEKFVRTVNASQMTGNLDNLEGGMDALMQVLVCPEEIGWKPEARKIVVLVTDGYMHFAGDGLLAGITERNDKRCHLDAKTGEYTASLQYDYPSIEEIYRELVKRKVNIIFAVTVGVVSTYDQMSQLMKGISNVEIISTDSSNILELIRKSYESFVQRTQFTDNSPDFIDVSYSTNCGGLFSQLRQRNSCDRLTMGEPVEFFIDLMLNDYPTDGNYKRTIRIEETSLNEYMEIEVEIQKPCTCNEITNPDEELSAALCSFNGYMHCGECQCDEGWTGLTCSCSSNGTNATTLDAIDNLCRKPFESSNKLGPICSNHGECDCGECSCMLGYNGRYCECPDCNNCDLEHAVCECGTCNCKSGWYGDSCECSTSVELCVGPSGEICSGRGFCKCNKCSCTDDYMGQFCEIASSKENKLCSFFEPCVTCLIEQKLGIEYCENVTELCSSPNKHERYSYMFVSNIDSDVSCLVRLTQNAIICDHYFTYYSNGESENYLAIAANTCEEPTGFLVIGASISGLTALLGIIIFLVIWCCIRMKDRREYARFEADQRNSVLMQSPLYIDPITHYDVPLAMKDDYE